MASVCAPLEEAHVFRNRQKDNRTNILRVGVTICTRLALSVGCHMTRKRYHIVDDCSTIETLDDRLLQTTNPVRAEFPGTVHSSKIAWSL